MERSIVIFPWQQPRDTRRLLVRAHLQHALAGCLCPLDSVWGGLSRTSVGARVHDVGLALLLWTVADLGHELLVLGVLVATCFGLVLGSRGANAARVLVLLAFVVLVLHVFAVLVLVVFVLPVLVVFMVHFLLVFVVLVVAMVLMVPHVYASGQITERLQHALQV